MTVAFYTLGCKVNQNETGALMRLFEENGYIVAQDDKDADVFIVNSCTVTAAGGKKSLQWLRRAKRKNPLAVTVLTGCYPQAFPTKAKEALEADIITGSNARAKLLNYIQEFIKTKKRIIEIAPHEASKDFEELPLQDFKGHTRAFLKIEDGCNRKCTYCVIPRARGSVRSLSEISILSQINALSKNGYREVVLSGINLSSYGQDNGSSLEEIVEKASLVEGIDRIRLGSLEPDLMSDGCINRLATIDKLCPQFHLALQSGCDNTLKRMNRLYTTAQYLQVIQKLKAAFPNATFTTDIIVGFPDETEQDFEESMLFIKKIGFLKVHVFSYSKREGTPAYSMENQIDESIKLARSRKMQSFADEIRTQIIENMRGDVEYVLLETAVNGNTFTGYTRTYVPVLVTTENNKQGDIVKVRLKGLDNKRCLTLLA